MDTIEGLVKQLVREATSDRRRPYRHRRWARCIRCEAEALYVVFARRGMRLRHQRCRRCGGRVRSLTAAVWSQTPTASSKSEGVRHHGE